jgi:hypothetical protein
VVRSCVARSSDARHPGDPGHRQLSVRGRVGQDLIGAEVGYLVVLGIAVIVTAYLVAAMLFPEKF